jgi:hypothetical protein
MLQKSGGVNMNKKIVAITMSLVISGGVLIGTAYTNASQLSGYEAYKLAVKDTANVKNETANVNISVKDNTSLKGNNVTLVDVTTNVKVNSAANAMSQSTTVKSSNGGETFSTFIQDGKIISKSSISEVYNVRESKHGDLMKEHEKMNPQVIKSVETVVDILSGNMKDNVVVSPNADGTKNISVSLDENQIIPLVNAIASIVMVTSSNEPMHTEKAGSLDVKNMIPQLVSEIKVTSVKVTGDINKDNIINNQVAKIVLSGKDANDVSHSVTIDASLNLSNINTTTPDTIDLTGKQIKTITSDPRGRFHQ